MPQQMSGTTDKVYCLCSSKFSFSSNLDSCDIIRENFKWYKNVLFPPRIYNDGLCLPSDSLLTELKIEIQTAVCPSYPDSDMDESCKFELKKKKNCIFFS
jgi:uncharacterized Rmd1/YagE family protein